MNRHRAQEKTKLYDNIMMLSPQGEFMCYTLRRKADWYIERNLAVWSNEDRTAFRLLIEPNGPGATHEHGKFPLENHCVVCGSEEHLQYHHVVPYMFRKWFPEEYKSRNNHDVVGICNSCHVKYERLAEQFKYEIYAKYGITYRINDISSLKIRNHRIESARWCFRNKIHLIRDQRQRDKIVSLSEQEILPVPSHPYRYQGKDLIDKVLETGDLQDFIVLWRNHFIKHAKPQFMPTGWDINFNGTSTIRGDIIRHEKM